MYFYRAPDSAGNTLDSLLNATRSRRAAKRFFRKVLGGKHITTPRVINVDKNPTYDGPLPPDIVACQRIWVERV
jgi:transposase, IS6 family